MNGCTLGEKILGELRLMTGHTLGGLKSNIHWGELRIKSCLHWVISSGCTFPLLIH
jgi:hypothetical protein